PLPPLSFDAPAPTAIYTLSLHDALPIYGGKNVELRTPAGNALENEETRRLRAVRRQAMKLLKDPVDRRVLERMLANERRTAVFADRKSTRLNSSHVSISYAVFCLKKKKK